MTTNLLPKQHKSITSQFRGQKSDTGLPGWNQIKMSAALHSFWKAPEKNLFPSLREAGRMPDRRTKAAVFLLALNRGSLPAPRRCSIVCLETSSSIVKARDSRSESLCVTSLVLLPGHVLL